MAKLHWGLYIATAYWGRGFATEAGSAFVKLGFDVLQMNQIVAMIDVRNTASVKVVEKLGFEQVDAEIIGSRSFYHYVLTKEKFDMM